MPANANDRGLTLDAYTQVRLGLQLQVLYKPVIDNEFDQRLTELLLKLDGGQERVDVG